MGKKKSKLITQSEAARIAGVARQTIGKIKKFNRYNFFVEDEGKNKINTSHPHWRTYLNERGQDGSGRETKREIEKKIIEPQGVKGKKKRDGNKVKKVTVASRQKNAFTGGFNPDDYVPLGISDIKRLTEIQKLKLEMEVRIGDLFDRDLLTPVLDALAQTIQAYFVDLPRKVSSRICRKLDRVGMEKDVEKILVEPIARGIREVKRVTDKAAKIKRLRK